MVAVPMPAPMHNVTIAVSRSRRSNSSRTVPKIIAELVAAKNSERQLRVIDHDQDGSMELKKREGYF